MLVCLCKKVSDKQLFARIADGCTQIEQLKSELGVCTQCKNCEIFISQLLKDYLARRTTTINNKTDEGSMLRINQDDC